MNFVLFACMTFLFTSCGTSIVVSPRGCVTKAQWGKKISNPDFVIVESVWSPLGFLDKQHVSIKKMLKSKKIYCSQLRRVSVVVRSSWQDVLRSIIPFAATRSVEVAGTFVYSHDLVTMDGREIGPSHDE